MPTGSRLLPCVEIGPPDADSAVIWLHGLGASGHDFEPIVPRLELPRTRFVFPHAPRRPVTINMGFVMPAWYDILTVEHGGTTTREPQADIREAAPLVSALIDRENERGIPDARIVLAGFSQGGAMALHVGVRHPRSLAGIMVLSAYLLLPEAYETETEDANRRTPMLFCHGTHDTMVPPERGRRAFSTVSQQGREASWHEFPMQHEVCPQEIAVIAAWLHARL